MSNKESSTTAEAEAAATTTVQTSSSPTTSLVSSVPNDEPQWISDYEIDPKWICAVTSLKHVIQCTVQDISNSTRTGDVVRNGATLRLFLTYRSTSPAPSANATTSTTSTDNVDDDSMLPKTLVLKQVAPNGLLQSKQLGLAREAYFYKHVLLTTDDNASATTTTSSPKQHILQPFLPKVYYAHGDMKTGSKFVLMEDFPMPPLSQEKDKDDNDNDNDNTMPLSSSLSSTTTTSTTSTTSYYIDSGILFGPGNPNNWKRNLKQMIQSAYRTSTMVPTSYQVANCTFLAMARVHATFWNDTQLLLLSTTSSSTSTTWLRGAEWLQGNGQESWQASQNYIQSIWNRLVHIDKTVDIVLKWDPLVRQIVETAVQGISWQAQCQRLHVHGHWTLVHGDFWPGNVLFETMPKGNIKNEEYKASLKLLDWEMVGIGSGPQDLGQYILSNMDPSERRCCEEQLIRNYYEELIRCGSSSNNSSSPLDCYTWEECYREYQIGGLERWLWFLIYFCGQQGEILKWGQFFHDQIQAFVHDHNIQPHAIVQPRP